MFDILKDTYRVAWADLCFLKRSIVPVLVSSVITPLLYLIVFGYGVGGSIGDSDKYIAFVIPGIIALSTLSTSFSSTASKIMIQRKFYGSFDEIVLCPIKTSSLVLGKSILGVSRGLISSLILMVLGVFISSAFRPSLLMILCVILSCLTFSLMGVTAGLIVKSQPSLNMFTSLVIAPMTFLSGTVFPIGTMPVWFQYVVYAMPLTYSTEIIRASALNTVFPFISLIIMMAFSFIFFAISHRLIEKGKY